MLFYFALFVISALVFALGYYFMERAQSFGRGFFKQVTIDILRMYHKLRDERLDEKEGLYTHVEIPVAMLTNDPNLIVTAKKYQATPYGILEKVFYHLKVLGLTQYYFIDYGCGMGRSLSMAAKNGFNNLIGIDINTRLLDICNKNLRQYTRAYRNSQIVQTNAEEYTPPDGNSVYFLFNPFNQDILEKALENILKAKGKKVLVYVNPVHSQLLRDKGGRLILHEPNTHDDFSFEIYRLPENKAAHAEFDFGEALQIEDPFTDLFPKPQN